MPTAEHGQFRIHYEVHGNGEPVLAIAGLGASHDDWLLLLPQLTEACRVIVFDNRDSGRSSRAAADYAMADLAGDVLAVVDDLGLERFHVLGHSMGGAIAQHVALAAPNRVRSLLLVATWLASGAWERFRGAVLEASAGRLSRAQLVDLMLAQTFSPRFFEQSAIVDIARSMLLDDPYAQAPADFVRQLRATYTHDLRGRTASLEMPVHIVAGELDVLLPIRHQRELHAAIPRSALTVLPDAAHGVHLEQPEMLARIADEFFAENPIEIAADAA